jgi:LysR family nod box-dependent transcriptional activator
MGISLLMAGYPALGVAALVVDGVALLLFSRLHRVQENPVRALERGEIDLLIMPIDYAASDHPSEVLFTETFSCVVWSGSRFAAAPLTFEQYAAASHVAVQPAVTQLSSFEAWFVQRYGLERHDEVKTFSFASAAGLVVGTELIATVHTRLARLAARHLPIIVHTPPLPFPEMQQVMQWHKYRSKDPGLSWLREVFLQAVADMDGGPDQA